MQQNTSLAKKEDYYDEYDGYSRSNFMISSKYRSTLFSNRLMAISLSRLSTATESDDGYLTVTIKGRDIQKLFGVTGNSFFGHLSDTANNLTGHTIGWSNPVTQEFQYISVVTKATYKNGEFSIDFHKDIKDYLIDLTQNYTRFSLNVMMSFKSSYSFRLYELIKSRCYYRKGEERSNNLFRIEFDINELRLALGVVNAGLDNVKRILNNRKGKPDYAKAVEASPEKLFETWYDFRKNVIDTAVKEINRLQEEGKEPGIYINNYEAKKAGRGGKVYAVVFYVEVIRNDKGVKSKQPVIDDNKDDILDEIFSIIEGIRTRDARAIGEAAKWDIDKIKRNYEYAKTKDIDNMVAYMIKAVKDDYAAAPVVSNNKMHFGTERCYSKEDYRRMEENIF